MPLSFAMYAPDGKMHSPGRQNQLLLALKSMAGLPRRADPTGWRMADSVNQGIGRYEPKEKKDTVYPLSQCWPANTKGDRQPFWVVHVKFNGRYYYVWMKHVSRTLASDPLEARGETIGAYQAFKIETGPVPSPPPKMQPPPPKPITKPRSGPPPAPGPVVNDNHPYAPGNPYGNLRPWSSADYTPDDPYSTTPGGVADQGSAYSAYKMIPREGPAPGGVASDYAHTPATV